MKEYKSGLPNKKLEIILSDAIWKDVTPGTVVKLLTSIDDAKFFDIKATKPESFDAKKLKTIVDYEILPLLEEYCFDDAEKVQRREKNLRSVFDE